VPVAIFLVEDNDDIRENLVSALEELARVEIVGTAATEDDALAWLAQRPQAWDVLLVDLFLKGGNGIRLMQRVQRAHAGQKLVVFSNYVNASVRKRCAQIGVDAVFDKSTEIDALVDYCAHQSSLLAASPTPAPSSPPKNALNGS
jgi:two-component system, OmpR family, response regulator